MANYAVLISNHYDGCETECTTSLGYLGYAVHSDQSVLQFDLARFNSLYVCF